MGVHCKGGGELHVVHCNLEVHCNRGSALQRRVHCTWGCIAIWSALQFGGVHCMWGCITVWEGALQRGLLAGLTPTGPASGYIHASHPAACPDSCFSTLLPPITSHCPPHTRLHVAPSGFGVWGFLARNEMKGSAVSHTTKARPAVLL